MFETGVGCDELIDWGVAERVGDMAIEAVTGGSHGVDSVAKKLTRGVECLGEECI